MRGNDLVSIVIPVFNGARFVGEAIASALAQTWPAVEVIVVDDGSDDGGATRRAVARFGDAVRLISKPNGGVATALNAGVAAMRGEWFSWLSHDDVYRPTKVERTLAAVRDRAGPAIAFADYDLIDESGAVTGRAQPTHGFTGEDGRWAVLECRLHGCAMMVPRAPLVAAGGFDPRWPTVNDYALWYALGRSVPFVPVAEPLIGSRVHDGQGSRHPGHLEEASLLWVRMLEEMEDGESLARAARFVRASPYAGARAYVESRLGTTSVPVLAARPAKPAHRPQLPTLLLVIHGYGGGSTRYAATLGARYAGRVNVLYAWGMDDRRLCISSTPESPEVEYDLARGLDAPVADLRRRGVARVDVLHSLGLDAHLDDLLDRLGVPFDVTLLDYHHVATGPHLLTPDGHFVGDDALVDPAHPARRAAPTRLILRAAARRIACSRDLAARAARLAPGLPIIAARIPEPRPLGVCAPPLLDSETMRVLFLGRITPVKGSATLTRAADLIAGRGLPLHLTCLGADAGTTPAALLRHPAVTLLGGYAQDELNPVICRIRPHLAWLPFTAPETHSFALSDTMAQGLPILATGIGAIPERLEGRAGSWQLTPAEATAERFVDWLERLRRERLAMAARWLPTDHLPPLVEGFYEREYLRWV
jgi:hypothetical protein